MLLRRALVGLEFFHLGAVHVLHDLVGLPLFEAEAEALVRVVLVVGLVLVVLDLDEVAVDGGGGEGEGDDGVDGGGFGDHFEGPGLYDTRKFQHDSERRRERIRDTHLFVFELDQTGLILNDFVLLIFAVLEQLRQSEPLPRHLVPIIGVHELIVVNAVGRLPPHLLDGRLAAVEVDDVVDEGLALLGEGERLGRVRGVVFGRGRLAGLVVFAGGGGGDGGGFHFAV